MKEVPILYSTPMMRANLAGTKTETRRTRGLAEINQAPDEWQFCELELNPELVDMHTEKTKQLKGLYATFMRLTGDHEEYRHIRCPYGQPGDLLWSRETFAKTNSTEYLHKETNQPYFYMADVANPASIKKQIAEYGWKWQPNIHMPKAAARHWSLNEEVSIERLHDITEQAAIAEGVNVRYEKDEDGLVVYDGRAKQAYETLWESINDTGSYAPNPWVWVIKYKTLSTTGKPLTTNY